MIQPSFAVKWLLLGGLIIFKSLGASQQPDASEASANTQLEGSLTPYQYLTAILTPDGSKFMPFSPKRSNPAPLGANLAGRSAHASLTLKGKAHVHQHFGNELFPRDSGLATAFDALTNTFKNTGKVNNEDIGVAIELSQFVMLFRKIQFLVLNDLYIYLTDVYSTFNLTMPKKSQTDTTITLPITIDSYLAEEYGGTSNKPTALNKKSIIVGQLLNVIQAQMYYICQHCYPLMPKEYAIKSGRAALHHDISVDPLILLVDMSKPFFKEDLATDDQRATHAMFKNTQTSYLAALKEVISFFELYTNGLNKVDDKSNIPGATVFARNAQAIADLMQQSDAYKERIEALKKIDVMGADGKIDQTKSTARSKALRALKQEANSNEALRQINPPLFYYDTKTLRAIRLIPQVAAELPKNVQSIDLPDQLVKAAKNGTRATDAQGNYLGYSVAEMYDNHLYINMPSQQRSFYRQEIKSQPNWLNNKDGVIEILQACFGDYSKLVGKNILAPCVENIILCALGQKSPDMTFDQLGTCAASSTTVPKDQTSDDKSVDTALDPFGGYKS